MDMSHFRLWTSVLYLGTILLFSRCEADHSHGSRKSDEPHYIRQILKKLDRLETKVNDFETTFQTLKDMMTNLDTTVMAAVTTGSSQ